MWKWIFTEQLLFEICGIIITLRFLASSKLCTWLNCIGIEDIIVIHHINITTIWHICIINVIHIKIVWHCCNIRSIWWLNSVHIFLFTFAFKFSFGRFCNSKSLSNKAFTWSSLANKAFTWSSLSNKAFTWSSLANKKSRSERF